MLVGEGNPFVVVDYVFSAVDSFCLSHFSRSPATVQCSVRICPRCCLYSVGRLVAFLLSFRLTLIPTSPLLPSLSLYCSALPSTLYPCHYPLPLPATHRASSAACVCWRRMIRGQGLPGIEKSPGVVVRCVRLSSFFVSRHPLSFTPTQQFLPCLRTSSLLCCNSSCRSVPGEPGYA